MTLGVKVQMNSNRESFFNKYFININTENMQQKREKKINSCQEVQMEPVTDKRESAFHITKLYL